MSSVFPSLVLASASPRRRQFLEQLGYAFEVIPADVDESPLAGESPADYVARVSASKALSLSERLSESPGRVVLAADTIVTIEGQLLGKPRHLDDALAMLRTLSGRTHEVLSGVVARAAGGEIHARVVSTRVTFRALTDDEIRWYWDTGEPRDKAGSYAIQGIAGAFIASIEGSHSSVIGLPLVETVDLLRAAGLAPPWERTH